MIKDLPVNEVKDIGIAIVLEEEFATEKSWRVYLLNFKKLEIQNVLVSSKGYGIYKGEDVKTSVLRHSLGDMGPISFKPIEAIHENLFALTNEFHLSFYVGNTIFDKKFIFVTESVVESNFIRIPLVNKPGVLIAE